MSIRQVPDSGTRRPSTQSLSRRAIRVQGIVQGVGFRPYVARLATGWELSGQVENTSQGVEIEVQGGAAAVEGFLRDLPACLPPMAMILELSVAEIPPVRGEAGFRIRASRIDPVAAAVIPPDIATCARCLAELADPANRRHRYPFINCTDCGPRYSIIRSIPYDRPRTGMAEFELCPACAAEYASPATRRFHAQPNACPSCGPQLVLKGVDGSDRAGDPLHGAVTAIHRGDIVALLGLGGFHLACDATDEAAVARLRARKQRPAKPFAVMVPDFAAARRLAAVTEQAAELLAGPRAPILLLPSRSDAGLAPSVAPGQDRLGLFLPYTPLHHLLFREGGFTALVMTSGNRSDEPILALWEEARHKLAGVADLFLLHDRPIVHRIDDSVVKTMAPSGPVVLRRARGYAPAPLPLPNPSGQVILSVGAELANAFAVSRGDYTYLGPHVGDLKNLEVEQAFREGIEHLLGLLQVRPDRIACDLHPHYVSSRYAAEWEALGTPVLRIQHHEAHAAGCMAEHGFSGQGVALVADGFGYGTDGSLCGCEILVGRPGQFRRVGHLTPVAQPGGDKAALEPWRMAASYLRRLHGGQWTQRPLPALTEVAATDRAVLDGMLARGFHAPPTTSCGRLFDAAAAILGFRGPMLYSAQAPMELEALAARCPVPVDGYPADGPQREGDLFLLDPLSLIARLEEDVLAGRDPREASLAFHRGLAELLASGLAAAAEAVGVEDCFLTGGCFQNDVLLREISSILLIHNLSVNTHRQVPPNDGGICFGQAAWTLGWLAANPSQ